MTESYLSKIRPQKERGIPLWLYFIPIATINFFSLSYLELKIYQYVHLLIIAFFFYQIISKHDKYPRNLNYYYVLALLIIPLFSVFSGYILRGQPFFDSLIVYRMHLGWLVFFVCAINGFNEREVAEVITVVGITFVAIVLIQQITFPFAPFGSRTIGTAYDTDLLGGVERRFGFYRFGVGGINYLFLLIVLVVSKKIKVKKVLFPLLFIAVLAVGSRGYLLGVTVGVSLFYLRKEKLSKKVFFLLALVISFFIIYEFVDRLIGDINRIETDFNEARLNSYTYYWLESTKSQLSFFFGNGVEHGKFYEEIYYMGQRVILADIGLLGTLYHWGVIYVFVFLSYMLRLLLSRYLEYHYKAFVIGLLASIWVNNFLWEIGAFTFLGLFAYLCEINIRNNIVVRKSTKNKYNLYLR